MPYKANRLCNHPGCSNIVTDALKCAEHSKPIDTVRVRSAWDNWYSNKQWRAIRMSVLASEPFCCMCRQQGKLTASTVVDHIIPHRGDKQMFLDRANLQALCKACHDSKTAREDGGFGNAVASRGRG